MYAFRKSEKHVGYSGSAAGPEMNKGYRLELTEDECLDFLWEPDATEHHHEGDPVWAEAVRRRYYMEGRWRRGMAPRLCVAVTFEVYELLDHDGAIRGDRQGWLVRKMWAAEWESFSGEAPPARKVQ